jgi:hypothetical protein
MRKPDLIRELLVFVDDVLDDLRSRKEIRHIQTILNRGTSSDEQPCGRRPVTLMRSLIG